MINVREEINFADYGIKLETKTVTIREVYEALEHNGFEHLRQTWFGNDESVYDPATGFTPTKGCVLAQTAFNLGVVAIESNIGAVMESQTNDSFIKSQAWSATQNLSLYAQLNQIWIDESSKWYKDMTSDGRTAILGAAIIYWNDLERPDGEGYVLETYADVAAMAKDLMEPFFDRTIEVLIASKETGIPLVV